MKDEDRNFFKPLRTDGPYRHNPERALPPRVLVTARFLALLSGETTVPKESAEGFRKCLDKLGRLNPVVDSGFMEGGHIIKGGFWVRTIWSSNPSVPDIVLVTAPGDTGHLGIPLRYEETGDESLLASFTPISLPYVN